MTEKVFEVIMTYLILPCLIGSIAVCHKYRNALCPRIVQQCQTRSDIGRELEEGNRVINNIDIEISNSDKEDAHYKIYSSTYVQDTPAKDETPVHVYSLPLKTIVEETENESSVSIGYLDDIEEYIKGAKSIDDDRTSVYSGTLSSDSSTDDRTVHLSEFFKNESSRIQPAMLDCDPTIQESN